MTQRSTSYHLFFPSIGCYFCPQPPHAEPTPDRAVRFPTFTAAALEAIALDLKPGAYDVVPAVNGPDYALTLEQALLGAADPRR